MKKKFSIALGLAAILVLILATVALAQYVGSSWTTNYQVVNVGTGPADITISYYDSSGVEVVAARKEYLDVPVGGSRKVIQFSDDPNLPSGNNYSAVVSADEPVVAMVGQQLVPDSSASYAPVPPFSSYSGEDTGSTQITLPSVLYNWYGYYTEFYVMNTGAATDNNVDITYIPGVVDGCTTGATGQTELNVTVPQFASINRNQEAQTALGAASVVGCEGYAGRFSGSAIITSDEPIVAVVNQHAPTYTKLATYNGFKSGAQEILVPQYMRGYYGYYSNIGISNPSSSQTAIVDIIYTPSGTSNVVGPGETVQTVTVSHTIAPQTTLVRYDGPTASDVQSDLDDSPNYSRFYGAVKVTSDIDVVVLASVESSSIVGSFNGIPVPDATEDVVFQEINADYWGYYTTIVVQNATGTAGSCDITYTSDGTYSGVTNHSETYTHALPANGSFTVYEGHGAGGNQFDGDINSDPVWGTELNRKFLGSATMNCDVDVVAFISLQGSIADDAVYTFNAVNKAPATP